MLVAAVATLLISWAIRHSRFGAGLFAIHDDEDAAEVMGVATYRWKLAALAVSCALAGWVGGIHALFVSYVTTAETFNLTVPLTVVLMSILGGTRHWAGPAIGAVAITCLLFAFTGGAYRGAGQGRDRADPGHRHPVHAAKASWASCGASAWLAWERVPPSQPPPAGEEQEPPPRSRRSIANVPLAQKQSRRTSRRSNRPSPGSVGWARARCLLRVNGLGKSFRGLKALSNVTLEVRRGEILGLLGPNGSGKSTFINVVSGHYLPDGGEVWLDGRNIAGLPAHEIARAGIARTYQIPRPFSQMSVLDNVAVAAMYAGQGLPSLEAGRREAMQWLEFTHLAGKAQSLPGELNLHQRKFLELARALASRPKLVLLDEVLCGLTPTEIQSAVEQIRRIRDQGTTIVFVEHVMDAVMALTDRLVVFDQGAMLAEGAPREVMQSPAVMSAYLGVSHA